MSQVWNWLVVKWNWQSAAAFCAVAMLGLAPLVYVWAGVAVFWVFLQIPLYMLHQWEEHHGDRFRTFTNAVIGHGVEVLSKRATFVINSAGVWGLDFLALYLAVFLDPGWSLMAFYLPLINALGHLVQAIILRRYNPGLITALLLFLPLSILGLLAVSQASQASALQQFTGLGIALFVHLLIILHVKRKLRLARKGAMRSSPDTQH